MERFNKMKIITYYKVTNGSNSISLTNKDEANALARSEFFMNVFNGPGVVEVVNFNIFDTAQLVTDTLKKELVEAALAKLSSVDRYILGL